MTTDLIDASPTLPPTPRQVADRTLQYLVEGAWDNIADLHAPGALIETPFAPPGVPRRTEGREELRAHFRFFAQAPPWKAQGVESVVIHETLDPEVVIAEYDLLGQVTATARPFTFSQLMVIRVRNGLIVSSRNYSDPLASAIALGMLPELLAHVPTERPK